MTKDQLENVQVETMEYYLHRKNRYYFRNFSGKLIASFIDDQGIMKQFKYGDKVITTMTFN